MEMQIVDQMDRDSIIALIEKLPENSYTLDCIKRAIAGSDYREDVTYNGQSYSKIVADFIQDSKDEEYLHRQLNARDGRYA